MDRKSLKAGIQKQLTNGIARHEIYKDLVSQGVSERHAAVMVSTAPEESRYKENISTVYMLVGIYSAALILVSFYIFSHPGDFSVSPEFLVGLISFLLLPFIYGLLKNRLWSYQFLIWLYSFQIMYLIYAMVMYFHEYTFFAFIAHSIILFMVLAARDGNYPYVDSFGPKCEQNKYLVTIEPEES